MATKSIWLKPFCVLSICCFLMGCESLGLKTRSQLERPPTQKEIEQTPELQPKVEKPDFLDKEAPKIGLILGGGGALTYAQIGLLQEFENQKIPIHSITGIEWGALVAGAYAMEAKAHSVEWKLLKLPKDKFYQKGLFSSGQSKPKIEQFDNFLGKVFLDMQGSGTQLPFACPILLINRERSVLKSKGKLRRVVRSCWASESHVETEKVVADYNAVSRLSRFLRSKGAEKVIYVDVVGKNTLLSNSLKKRTSEAAAILSHKSLVSLLQPPIVDQVISLPVSGHRIDSYKSLRSIIRSGQIKSKSIVKGVATQYAF